jgi:hypothetical protein
MDAAIIIGVIALVIAVPSAFQMIWGKPKITFDFRETDTELNRTLVCDIWNEPITDNILKILGVYRRSVVITADFQIYKAGTSIPLFEQITPEIITYNGTKGYRIVLDTSITPVSIQVAYTNKQDGKVFQHNIDTSNIIPLGQYDISINVSTDIKIFPQVKRFIVFDRYPYISWLNY